MYNNLDEIKYLKYKNKYLSLKYNLEGGVPGASSSGVSSSGAAAASGAAASGPKPTLSLLLDQINQKKQDLDLDGDTSLKIDQESIENKIKEFENKIMVISNNINDLIVSIPDKNALEGQLEGIIQNLIVKLSNLIGS